MSEALRTGKLNDEAVAFVTGTAMPPNSANSTPEPQPAPSAVAEVKTPASTSTSAVQPNVSPIAPPGDLLGSVQGTVSMTFRLPADLSARLIRVSAERKVRRERPFSQQDMVTEALSDWLRQHGHAG
ncbi:MAG TPA: hypothetical protein P5186_13760 [Candidatus Paceibacterota bacterium]|nr:hypothetical protein [Candidatus Paceibacterota bacterium]